MKGLFKPNPTREVGDQHSSTTLTVDEDELLTDEQVCAILKVKKQWLRDHTTRVEPIVPHIPTMGRHVRYPRRALYAWIREQIETRPSWERKKVSTG